MERIGPYELLEKLGEGAMGEVWRAHQSSLNRMIALKLLPSHRESDEMAVRRFRQEGQTAARLKHDNIVSVYDAHVDEPPYYIAMEFLEGQSLSDIIAQQGRLPPDQAVAIISQVCAGLEHAHEHGVIHRDIKPANVIVSATGRATITDFGIARATDQTRMTATGATFGTPDYMSPEQAKGLPVDHRTDLYSAGAMLFEALTGRPPFAGGGPLTVMNRIVNDPPPAPRGFYADISPALEMVVLKALAKDPRDRFQSGTEMAQALEAALRHPETVAYAQPPAPAPVSGTSPAISPPAPAAVPTPVSAPVRHRTALLGALLGVVALMIAGVLYFAVSRNHGGSPVGPSGTSSVSGRALAPMPATSPPSGAKTLVRVPDVVGKSANEAKSALRSAGFAYEVGAKTFDDTMPRGVVLRQNPAAGSEHSRDTAVRVVLSLGRGVVVPAVNGVSQADAISSLRAASLTWTVRSAPSSSVPAGCVIGCQPPSGQIVPVGATVKLTVSTGQPAVFTCSKCGATFRSSGALRQHIAQAHQPRPTFVCSTCGAEFSTRAALQAHVARFHTPKHICPTCGASFSTQTALNQHIASAHPVVHKYKCPICGQEFDSKNDLERHEIAHGISIFRRR